MEDVRSRKNGPWPYTYGWTIQDVGDFIRDLGYPQYSRCFEINSINWKQLPCIDVYDLQRFGVSRMEHAIEIMACIKKAVSMKLYNYDNPDEPPRHSYFGPSKSSCVCLPPVSNPVKMRLQCCDYVLPKRDQGGQYNRYFFNPLNAFHKSCRIAPMTKTTPIRKAKPSCCSCCYCTPCRC